MVTLSGYMSQISFAMYDAFCNGVTAGMLAERLNLPLNFVEDRLEAARLCIKLSDMMGGNISKG